MLIVPASKVSVPLTVVMRTRSSVPEVVFVPLVTVAPFPEVVFAVVPEITQILLPTKVMVIAPAKVVAALYTFPSTISAPEVAHKEPKTVFVGDKPYLEPA